MTERQSRTDGKVYFIGAGPGAVDLITVRGRRLIDTADCIIYAGSLVNPVLFSGCRVPLHDSAALHLEEIIEIMAAVVEQGGTVARVHTGDPALYGAIGEQMARLEQRGIAYEVVPGVSSAFAAAAALGVELTLPEVTQSVIITRREGRTPVPERESLTRLAASGSTMMIFLSVGMIEGVVADLLAGGYSHTTPVAVVMKASWPDQRVVTGTLADIGAAVQVAGIAKTAMICVGEVFSSSQPSVRSRLYDPEFSHGGRPDGEIR